MSQKLQYARWKAADGAKALREGRTPSSGPRMFLSDHYTAYLSRPIPLYVCALTPCLIPLHPLVFYALVPLETFVGP